MEQAGITRIGVFHFGRMDKSDPIRSLRAALGNVPGNELAEALVVIPEAFNIRGNYFVENERHLDHSIAESLRQTSRDFRLAIVAGLVDRVGARTCSSAYLIGGDVFELLCRKKGDDGSGTYTTYLNEHDRTISYRGICVAALLCMDAANELVRPSERHVALLRRMEFRNTAASVLCIPARMASYDTEAIVSDWSQHTTVALANGVSAKASVVWLINEPQAMTISKDQNAVLMVPVRSVVNGTG